MAIVSSSYATDAHQQVGGSRWTIETHVDSDGTKYTVGPYLWDGVVNRDTLLALHATQINDLLAEMEAQKLLALNS